MGLNDKLSAFQSSDQRRKWRQVKMAAEYEIKLPSGREDQRFNGIYDASRRWSRLVDSRGRNELISIARHDRN